MISSYRFLLASAFSLTVAGAWNTPHLQAADAAFSSDGKRIYYLDAPQEKGGALTVLDLESGTVKDSTVPALAKDGEILALSRGAKESLLLLTKNHLWRWNAKTNAAQSIETAPAGAIYQDVAADAKSGHIVLTTYTEKPEPDSSVHGLYLKRSESEKAVEVFVRRVSRLSALTFLPDGSLLFGSDGDLWHGTVDWDTEAEAGHPRGLLNSYRLAPLATRESTSATPSQIGVQHLAVSHGKVYAEVSRMGGSGWGDLVRLSAPPIVVKGELNIVDGLKERLDLYSRMLKSVEILSPDQDSESFLCTSPDGDAVHFTGHHEEKGRQHYLITKGGKAIFLKTHGAKE